MAIRPDVSRGFAVSSLQARQATRVVRRGIALMVRAIEAFTGQFALRVASPRTTIPALVGPGTAAATAHQGPSVRSPKPRSGRLPSRTPAPAAGLFGQIEEVLRAALSRLVPSPAVPSDRHTPLLLVAISALLMGALVVVVIAQRRT
jgi:hypothetical protein